MSDPMLDPPGFDTEKREPICPSCARVRSRRWICRPCGVQVCDCRTATQYLDGTCLCVDCDKWRRSSPVAAARFERLGLHRSAAAALAGEDRDGE